MISIVLSWLLFFHPIHVSVTDITLDEKDKELEIVSRIFVDDLELAIRRQLNQPELDILEPPSGMTTDQLVGDYLRTSLKITVDGKPVKTIFLGHEMEGEAMICYIQAPNIRRFKSIQVSNTTITEVYDDQSNLVHVTVEGKVKSMRLMKNNPMDKLTFNP